MPLFLTTTLSVAVWLMFKTCGATTSTVSPTVCRPIGISSGDRTNADFSPRGPPAGAAVGNGAPPPAPGNVAGAAAPGGPPGWRAGAGRPAFQGGVAGPLDLSHAAARPAG